ncbi:WxcM-like domain-containing protein [Ulvibacter litoralis]|uniref:WxcM-like, C-terminal n=1 Tax=Ulvibacter litoralis TaxID=227084 RepID=A0A1G7HN65_9FLAO|nr:WxcM-like domain-containing protein [Ulvibacter litoralis]GHC58452.1 sugar epimerase [Ulvibacter litoralis]SDF01907.1 WxcM-like, C-terminal [Ulvibacter litoralis]
MKAPKFIEGGNHKDARGTLCYNNEFDASEVKRFYTITNNDLSFKRGWTGHAIERRWFIATSGVFEITVIKIDTWEQPNRTLKRQTFKMSSDKLDVLEVPSGFVTSIQALETDSKLLVMSDYMLGEVTDEHRFESTYFSEE